MKITAEKVAYSSITGQSILLKDEKGQAIGQLTVLNPFPNNPRNDYQTSAILLADMVVGLINR